MTTTPETPETEEETSPANYLLIVPDLGIVGEVRRGEGKTLLLEFTDEGFAAVIKSYVTQRQNERAARLREMVTPEKWRLEEARLDAASKKRPLRTPSPGATE